VQYTVAPVMNQPQNGVPTLTGFRVTHILRAELTDVAGAGQVIDSLVQAGANRIYGVSFDFADPSALVRQARDAAMHDAQTKAEQLANLGGVTLGAPLVITEGVAPVPIDGSAAPGVRGGVPTAIQPGQQEVRVQVSVVYAIK
jgi:uncharacterized protein YggE